MQSSDGIVGSEGGNVRRNRLQFPAFFPLRVNLVRGILFAASGKEKGNNGMAKTFAL